LSFRKVFYRGIQIVCRSPGIQALPPQAEGYAYGQIERLLETEHLEEDQRINLFGPALLLHS
jgi:hypothetical protein